MMWLLVLGVRAVVLLNSAIGVDLILRNHCLLLEHNAQHALKTLGS